MDNDFVVQVKCVICWLNRGLRVYLDLDEPDFPESTCKYLFDLGKFFLVQYTLFWRLFWLKNHSKHVTPNVTKNESLSTIH